MMMFIKLVKKFLIKTWGNKIEIIFYCFSYTLLIANFFKFGTQNKASLIQRFNKIYFVLTSIFSIAIILNTSNINVSQNKYNFPDWFYICIGIYAFSRVNEIFIAFVRDAREQLKPPLNQSKLKYYERIMLAMRSYVELILLYGILQFILSFSFSSGNHIAETIFSSMGFGYFLQYITPDYINLFHCQPLTFNSTNNPSAVDSAWDAIYFSGITIATIGYGDLTPKCSLAQFLSIYEVVNGFVLIVVSFTIYVSRSIVNEEFKDKNNIKTFLDDLQPLKSFSDIDAEAYVDNSRNNIRLTDD